MSTVMFMKASKITMEEYQDKYGITAMVDNRTGRTYNTEEANNLFGVVVHIGDFEIAHWVADQLIEDDKNIDLALEEAVASKLQAIFANHN